MGKCLLKNGALTSAGASVGFFLAIALVWKSTTNVALLRKARTFSTVARPLLEVVAVVVAVAGVISLLAADS
jgi:fatty acid-binding protein DegV